QFIQVQLGYFSDVSFVDLEMQRFLFQSVSLAFTAILYRHEFTGPLPDSFRTAFIEPAVQHFDQAFGENRIFGAVQPFGADFYFFATSVQQNLHRFFRNFGNRGAQRESKMLGERFQLLEGPVFPALTDGWDPAFTDREGGVDDDLGHIHLVDVAQSVAFGAGSVRGIERKG